MTSLFVRLGLVLGLLRDRLDARSDRGATAVEYGLLVGVVAVGLIAVLGLFGESIATFFTTITGRLQAGVAASE